MKKIVRRIVEGGGAVLLLAGFAGYDTISAATAQGGCLVCHTSKGILPENRQ